MNAASDLTLEQFPRLLQASRNPDRLSSAVRAIADGVAAGSIRNVTLNEAKHTIGDAVYKGWEKHVSEPYFYAGKYESQPDSVREFEASIRMSGLYDVLLTHRKLSKTEAFGAAIDAMRSFVNECLPLAEAAERLKSKVVKGRRDSSVSPKPINPDRVVKTCPVCFRPIAVVRGLMAHHGYQRPAIGWQTASCPGTRFRPLEQSTDGLVWSIEEQEKRLAGVKAQYGARDTVSQISVRKGRTVVVITREHATWTHDFYIYCCGLETEMRALNADIKVRKKRLREWRPEPISAETEAV